MNVWAWIGVALIFIAIVEFVLFRYVIANQPGIQRNMRLLMLNCALNTIIGAVFLLVGIL